jgi:hypothetical protein
MTGLFWPDLALGIAAALLLAWLALVLALLVARPRGLDLHISMMTVPVRSAKWNPAARRQCAGDPAERRLPRQRRPIAIAELGDPVGRSPVSRSKTSTPTTPSMQARPTARSGRSSAAHLGQPDELRRPDCLSSKQRRCQSARFDLQLDLGHIFGL